MILDLKMVDLIKIAYSEKGVERRKTYMVALSENALLGTITSWSNQPILLHIECVTVWDIFGHSEDSEFNMFGTIHEEEMMSLGINFFDKDVVFQLDMSTEHFMHENLVTPRILEILADFLTPRCDDNILVASEIEEGFVSMRSIISLEEFEIFSNWYFQDHLTDLSMILSQRYLVH